MNYLKVLVSQKSEFRRVGLTPTIRVVNQVNPGASEASYMHIPSDT